MRKTTIFLAISGLTTAGLAATAGAATAAVVPATNVTAYTIDNLRGGPYGGPWVASADTVRGFTIDHGLAVDGTFNGNVVGCSDTIMGWRCDGSITAQPATSGERCSGMQPPIVSPASRMTGRLTVSARMRERPLPGLSWSRVIGALQACSYSTMKP